MIMFRKINPWHQFILLVSLLNVRKCNSLLNHLYLVPRPRRDLMEHRDSFDQQVRKCELDVTRRPLNPHARTISLTQLNFFAVLWFYWVTGVYNMNARLGGCQRGGEDGRVYKYTRYILTGVHSFNRGHAEREQVTQQVAVFTGFPGDETRAAGPVWWSPTPLPLPRRWNHGHPHRPPSSSDRAVLTAPYPRHPLTATKLLSGI